MTEVTRLVTQHSTTGWGVAIPAGASLMLGAPTPMGLTYGIVHASAADRARLASTAMSDVWVDAAGQLLDAAPKNLERLVHALDTHGFVSIADADLFCAVELANEQEAARPVNAEARNCHRACRVRAVLDQRLAQRGFVAPALGPVAAAEVPSLAADPETRLGTGLGVAAGLFHPSRFEASA